MCVYTFCCFVVPFMSFLHRFTPPRGVLIRWYLIWRPPPPPHNLVALKETETLQLFLSVHHWLFASGSCSDGRPSITVPG